MQGRVIGPMIRSTIMLVLIFFLLGGPQPIAQPLSEMTLYPDTAKNTAIPTPENHERPDPLTRYVLLARYLFRQSCIQAAAMKRGDSTRPVEPVKEIIISLANQQLYRFEDGRIISTHPVSTGVAGHRTPTGDYAVRRKSPKAWSNKYECMMLNWMAITSDGQFGIHALEGKSYLRKLGKPASHGCIRLSHTDAKAMYEWSSIGTPVTIVADFDPAPYLPKPVGTSLQPGYETVSF